MPDQLPYRVAFIITELDVGGAETCLTQLACGLDRTRFESMVYALGCPPPADQNQLVEQLQAARVPLCFVGARSAWEFRAARRRLTQALQQQQPQLAQTFLFHANCLGTWSARTAGVPHRVLGIRVADPAGWRRQLERQVARLCDRVVCVSQAVADQTRQGGVPAEKLVVIGNGLDVDKYPAQQAADLSRFGVPAERKALVYVGRLDRQKGLDWLIEVMPRLLHELPQHDLLLVGSGPQQQALERRAAQLGIAARVHFAGWRGDVEQILRASQLLLLPSRWEGMPNVLLEAMASELPVVATDAPGVQEVLGPLCQSQVVRFGDSEQFIRQVNAICRDSELATRLARANRTRVEGCFALPVMVRAYERLYEELLRGDERLNEPPPHG